MLSRLTKIAEEFNVAVYMTNQGKSWHVRRCLYRLIFLASLPRPILEIPYCTQSWKSKAQFGLNYVLWLIELGFLKSLLLTIYSFGENQTFLGSLAWNSVSIPFWWTHSAKLTLLLVAVIADPGGGVFISDPKKPAGGHVLAHAATVRLMFRKGKGEQRVCKVFDAPNLPEAEAISLPSSC